MKTFVLRKVIYLYSLFDLFPVISKNLMFFCFYSNICFSILNAIYFCSFSFVCLASLLRIKSTLSIPFQIYDFQFICLLVFCLGSIFGKSISHIFFFFIFFFFLRERVYVDVRACPWMGVGWGRGRRKEKLKQTANPAQCPTLDSIS